MEQEPPLFRKEALQHQSNRIFGNVVITQNKTIQSLFWLCAFLCLCLLLLLLSTQYARRERVQGVLMPDQGLIKIYASTSGIVAKRYVQEGMEVKKNEPLFLVRQEQSTLHGKPLEETVLKEYALQISQLETELKSLQTDASLEQKRLENNMAQLQQKLKSLEAQYTTQKNLYDLSKKTLNDYERLATEGHISREALSKQQSETLEQQQRLEALQQEYSTHQYTLTDIQLKLAQLPLNIQQRNTAVQKQLSERRSQIWEFQNEHEQLILSPAEGTLTAVQALPGQYFTQNHPLATLLPKGSTLEAHLFVPTRAIGTIHQNQKVYLRYDAFPYQRFGIYEGTITQIARAALLPQEVPQIPITLTEPVYRVTVQLSQTSVQAYGKTWDLQPGMQLEADLLQEKRNMFSWLLMPLKTIGSLS